MKVIALIIIVLFLIGCATVPAPVKETCLCPDGDVAVMTDNGLVFMAKDSLSKRYYGVEGTWLYYDEFIELMNALINEKTVQ